MSGPSNILWSFVHGWNRSTNTIDEITATYNALKTVSADHERIHAGKGYNISFVSSIAAGAIGWTLISIPNSVAVHMRTIKVAGVGAPFEVTFRETTSVDVNSLGSKLTPINFNRSSTNISSVGVYTDPSVVSSGTLLDIDVAPVSAKDSGGQGQIPEQEWVLSNSGKWYLVGIKNNSGGNSSYNTKYFWYEP